MFTTTYLIGVTLFFIHSFLAMYLAKLYLNEERFSKIIRYLVCFFNATLSVSIINLLYINQSLAYVVISLIIIFEVLILFKDSFWGRLGVALSILIHFSASRSIILGIHALTTNKSVYSIASTHDLVLENTYIVILFHIVLISAVLIFIPVSAVKVMIKSKVFLPYLLIILFVLQMFFIFNVRMFTIDTAHIEISWQQIILPLLLLGIFYVILIFMIMLIKADDYKAIIQELETKNEIDELTGAYNKSAIKTKVSEYINEGKSGALFVFDIDNFKSINDYFGHAYGDKMLSEIHESIRKIVRREDFVGRFGGDEFVVFVKDCLDDNKLIYIANSICQATAKVHETYEGKEILVSTSIGIAISPKDARTYDELFICADTALYASKNKGKNTYTFYQKDLKSF